jgi:hypothetical protein
MDKRYKREEVRKRIIERFRQRPQAPGTGASLLANLKGLGMNKATPASPK